MHCSYNRVIFLSLDDMPCVIARLTNHYAAMQGTISRHAAQQDVLNFDVVLCLI